MELFRHTEPEKMAEQRTHDADYPAAREQYEREKRELWRRQVERLARVKRLGYDFDVVTGRGIDQRKEHDAH
jgi:hypothetical protein